MRHFLTCKPIKFLWGFVTDKDGKAEVVKICVHTHTNETKFLHFSACSRDSKSRKLIHVEAESNNTYEENHQGE